MNQVSEITTDRSRRKNRGSMMQPPGLGTRAWRAKSQDLEIIDILTLRTRDFELDIRI